jgi:hypothetical protein
MHCCPGRSELLNGLESQTRVHAVLYLSIFVCILLQFPWISLQRAGLLLYIVKMLVKKKECIPLVYGQLKISSTQDPHFVMLPENM